MLIILIVIMVAIYFHFRGMPTHNVTDKKNDSDDSHCAHCEHCGGTLDDHAKRIAKRCVDDPTHTPHN